MDGYFANAVISEELRRLLHARPFKPFRLNVADQAVHNVPHADWALINPAGSMMVVMDEAGYFDWISTAHITRITDTGEPQGNTTG